MDTHLRDKLLQTYAQGERKFTYWPLNGADLHDADLQDGNFYGSDLSGANLSGANLMRANLGNANLRNANLSNTFLAGANLSGADVDGTDFSGANYTSPPPIVTAQPIVTAVGDPISHYCIQCGAQLPAGTQFCPRCGHAQVSTTPAASPFSAPSPVTVPFNTTPPPTNSPPSTSQEGARIAAPAGQNTPHAPSVPPKVKSSSKPSRTDLQTLGVGVIFVLGGILLPSQTEQCSTTGFGQYCIETVYTYNGVSAPVCKGFLIVVGILCIIVAGVLFANRNT